ncbi:MAG: VCBS repeat-containing protein, partial [Planctomycetes bacterium]|nr:VCBS repeat-containing protein [Planctomycetota bacterium]
MTFSAFSITCLWTAAPLLLWCAPAGAQQLSDYRSVNPSVAPGVLGAGAGDLNGDGQIDVITTSETDGRLVWYQNMGLGVFSPGVELARDEPHLGNVELADLDGDGDLDILPIATVLENSQGYVWFENQGAGTFERNHLPLTPA